ncbi:amine dehydrogenase large subunit [Derxia gummosa]|uniref:Amine dehydrogenase large subunit n=1 Tax=Derxia gummosa DSM 723 TaxID=1121388 RepID=A0A8B6X9Q5_9BURK|nr:amine dehydrogenase large subunit [Derxia gummosa]
MPNTPRRGGRPALARLVRFLLAAGLAGAALSGRAFEPETIDIATLSGDASQRLWLPDAVLSHIADGRLLVVDGASMKVAATVGAGMSGQYTLSPDRGELYVATTYHSRVDHGERSDVLSILDASTLRYKGEVVLPPKHAQAIAVRGLLRTTASGRYALVYNATPATSVTIVDLPARAVLGEIPTPGCWALFPAQSVERRFATLCGDGRLLTVDFDEAGKPVRQARGDKVFDPDTDPLYTGAEQLGDDYLFVSFHGKAQRINVAGETARPVEAPWSLLDARDAKQGWRPGGYQFYAVHAQSNRLYIGMHPKGADGTHKNPAKEIWVFDLATRKRLQRLPGFNATALGVTRTPQPTLYVLDGATTDLVRVSLDGKPRETGRLKAAVEAPAVVGVN